MKKLLLLSLIPLLFISCKKYEDGPYLSCRSAEKRLTGKWKVSELLYNQKDITVAYYAPQLDLYPFNIYSDWSHSHFIAITHADGSIIAKSPLVLNKKKTVMSFCLVPEDSKDTIVSNIFNLVPPLSAENNWTILRLKNDEFWMRTDYETNNFEIHFDLLTDFNDF